MQLNNCWLLLLAGKLFLLFPFLLWSTLSTRNNWSISWSKQPFSTISCILRFRCFYLLLTTHNNKITLKISRQWTLPTGWADPYLGEGYILGYRNPRFESNSFKISQFFIMCGKMNPFCASFMEKWTPFCRSWLRACWAILYTYHIPKTITVCYVLHADTLQTSHFMMSF